MLHKIVVSMHKNPIWCASELSNQESVSHEDSLMLAKSSDFYFQGTRVNSTLIRNGFIAAAAMNIGGVLFFSRGFTNTAINSADPVVMSNFGLLMIVVWGFAYLGSAFVTSSIKWLAGAFAVEKLIYVAVWINWLLQNNLAQLYSSDVFAGVFFSIYGVNDLIFMLFFAWVFLQQPRGR